jgi:UDP-N-acetylglucosamine--N-acetylmuramyl-(pentapeptide) pyrophosphoryl-undecaprenol N-acetylglucosamine transferase
VADERQRTILVMAGGTGGHVFPALAVAQALRERGWRVVWLGTRAGMESTVVPKHGFELQTVEFSGLRGKGLLAKLLLPARLLIAFWQSLAVIRRVQPQVVLGMGGYISFPGGMMASLLNRPLVVHEQNAIAGLANRLLSNVADRTLVAFPNAIARALHVGNPVRADIVETAAATRARTAERHGPLRVLVIGGSQGAQALNECVPRALALLPAAERPIVTHQAGARNLDALKAAYDAAGVQGTLVPFIDDMASAYANADLVICRAGAMTIAELAAAGVASILVPFPHAVDDHQTANARYLSDHDAGVLLAQSSLTPERLADELRRLPRATLAAMGERARALAKPDATAVVANHCERAARGARPLQTTEH